MGASHSEAMAALGSESDEEDDATRRMPTISDALGRGLAVKVNGNNWKRAVVHVDEDEEEAIVIVYGLVPRKKYDIDLGIAASEEHIQETITTQTIQGDPATTEMNADPTNEHATDSATSPSTLTPPMTPVRSSPPRIVSQEERVAQLRKQLAMLNSERDDLALQLKLARRGSQRTETALKSEIETLKRASEKHASSEHRSRQKVLALQEAVKQASAATGDIEELVKEIEATMPSLSKRAEEVEVEHMTMKGKADRSSAEAEATLQADRKMVADLQGELSGVCARLEKVTGKKEKLEKEVVPRLEERLQELRRAIAEMEREIPDEDDPQHGNEDVQGAWNVRTWVPPIQRPQQRPNFSPPIGVSATSPPFTAPRRCSFRPTRPSNVKSHNNVSLPPLLPSYDPNFSLQGMMTSEETSGIPGLTPRVTSDLKSGSTFHTPPRCQAQSKAHSNPASFDFVVRRPSPNPKNEDNESPPSQMFLTTSEANFEPGSSFGRGDYRTSL